MNHIVFINCSEFMLKQDQRTRLFFIACLKYGAGAASKKAAQALGSARRRRSCSKIGGSGLATLHLIIFLCIVPSHWIDELCGMCREPSFSICPASFMESIRKPRYCAVFTVHQLLQDGESGFGWIRNSFSNTDPL